MMKKKRTPNITENTNKTKQINSEENAIEKLYSVWEVIVLAVQVTAAPTCAKFLKLIL